MVGTMLFVAFHLQIVLGMAPFVAGLATTPQTIAIMFVAGIGLRFLDKFGPKAFIVLGSFVTSAAFFYLAQATSSGSYLVQVLPALILSGVGLGLVFMPMQNLAMRGISSIDAGVAGAALNGFNQIGGSIGLAVFTSLAASYGNLDVVARLAGYNSVFAISAVLQFATGVIALVALPTKLEPVNTENYATVTAH